MADKKNFWEGLSDNVKIIVLFIVMLVGIVLISKVFNINSWLIFGVAILAFLDRQARRWERIRKLEIEKEKSMDGSS